MSWTDPIPEPPQLPAEWPSATELAERSRKARAFEAVEVLRAAAEIRADADLMASVRAYLREQRDELALLLDTL